MKNSFFAFLLTFIFCIGSANAKLFDAQEFVLDNGMQVIVIPNHKAPIIRQMVWYKVGSVDEPLGLGGMAHLLEHLMFRGTKKIKDSDFNKIITENGGDINAFTSRDYTSYYEVMDISKLELAMFMEADRMGNLNISSENFKKERDIVYQERRQVVDNNPSSYFVESYRRNLWQNHPYGRSITGSPEEIMNLSLEDINEFYSKYYAPNNAILILSGDIDVRTAKVLAEKYYGPIKAREMGKKVEFPKLTQKFSDKLEMAVPRINATRIMKSYVAPSYNTDKSQIYALTILSKYLGEGETSKLYKKLVLDKKSALAVATSYDFGARSYGDFTISALPKEGINVVDFEQELQDSVNQAVAEINMEDIESTKHKMLAGLVYFKDNPNDAASIIGSMASVGMSLDEIENHAENIKKVDYKDVILAAKSLLNNSSNVTGILRSVDGGGDV